MAKCLFVLLGLILLVSCNQKNDEPITVNSPEIQQSAETLKIIFPHTNEFKKSRQHGAFHLKDPKLCQSCHGVPHSLTQKVAQSCTTCHQYPHDSGFVAKEHAEAYF